MVKIIFKNKEIKYKLLISGLQNYLFILKKSITLDEIPLDIGDLRVVLAIHLFVSNIIILLANLYCRENILDMKITFNDVFTVLLSLNHNILTIQFYFAFLIFLITKRDVPYFMILILNSFLGMPIFIIFDQLFLKYISRIHTYEIYLIITYYRFIKSINEYQKFETSQYNLIKYGFIFVQISIFYIYKVNFYSC